MIILEFFQNFWQFYTEVAFYLVLGFLIAGLLHLFFPERIVREQLGKGNIWSVLKATIFGIPIPICSCGVIPVAQGMRRSGASKGASLSFMITTPQNGADSFLISYSLLGPIFALARIVASFFTGIITGVLTNFLVEDEGEVEVANQSCSVENRRSLLSFFTYIQNELFGSIANSLLVGLVLAGLISWLVPADFFQENLSNNFTSMLLMAVVGIPLYVCSASSTPIAASLVFKGISPGAALVFLLTGPATNMVTISSVLNTYGKKALIIYLGSIAIVSIIFGYLLNLLLLDLDFIKASAHHSDMLSWMDYLGIAFLSLMFVIHYGKKVQNRFRASKIDSEKTVLKISNMECEHCKSGVLHALENVLGVSDIQVDLKTKTASFICSDGSCLMNAKKAISDAGFDLG